MAYKHSIKAASIKTGLSSHVIRIWEKRYGAVSPERSPTNRRLYSDKDIERLTLLRRATEEGHKIGQIARLSKDEILRLLGLHSLNSRVAGQVKLQGDLDKKRKLPSDHITDLMDAVLRFDRDAFMDSLSRAAVDMSRMLLLEEVIIPLIRRVDEMWNRGSLRIAHEHMVSSHLRSFLNNLDSTSHLPKGAPGLVITTPSGQVHELGALITASAAVMSGWKALYLGPDLPAEEICSVVRKNGASAVALSLVYPTDDPKLEHELRKLKELLPNYVDVIVGGRALAAYLPVLKEIDAKIITDMKTFCRHLEELSIRYRSEKSVKNPA